MVGAPTNQTFRLIPNIQTAEFNAEVILIRSEQAQFSPFMMILDSIGFVASNVGQNRSEVRSLRYLEGALPPAKINDRAAVQVARIRRARDEISKSRAVGGSSERFKVDLISPNKTIAVQT